MDPDLLQPSKREWLSIEKIKESQHKYADKKPSNIELKDGIWYKSGKYWIPSKAKELQLAL